MFDLITEFLTQNEYVIVAGIWCLGEIIKQTRVVDSRWIPFILLVVSVVLTPAMLGGYSASTINTSFIVAGMAVFADQILKQGEELLDNHFEEG